MTIGSNSRIAIGVVGAGFGAAVHVPAFRAIPGCEVIAICASSSEKARATADRLHIRKSYGTWRDLVKDPEVQAVAVALPPEVQPEVVLSALACMKPVFCEKPLALNLADAQAMAEGAQGAGVPNLVNFEFLEDRVWTQAAHWMTQRRLGQLRHVLVNWQVETYAHRSGLPSWKSSRNGGTLNLFVSHIFYYLERLAAPIQRLCARLHSPPGVSGAGDANTVVTAELNGGALAVVTAGASSPFGSGHRVECYGSDGALVLENATRDHMRGFTLRTACRGDDGFTNWESEDVPSVEGSKEDGRIIPVSRLASRFVEAIQSGSRCDPSIRAGLRVQVLLEAAKRSHRSGEWVETPEYA